MQTNSAIAFSDEQGMLLEAARDFCRDKSPITAVRALLGSESGFDATVWQEMVELGWPGIAISERYGGSGLGIAGLVPVAEAMGRQLLTTPLISSVLAARLLSTSASPAQQERWLPQLAAGLTATIALLENEDWGSTLVACRAESGADALQLYGDKCFVPDLVSAELLLVPLLFENMPALALVTRDRLPAGAVQAHTLVDETHRAGRLKLDGIRIDKENLVTGEQFAAGLRDVRLVGALLVAAEAVGSTASALDLVVDYLKTRKQFGRLIGSYQALKHPAVDILTQLESARSHVYHAAALVADAVLDGDTEIACRMAKALASDALLFAGDRAVQFHGGIGFTYDCDAQLYIRRAQWAQQQWGDARHHRKRLASLLLDD